MREATAEELERWDELVLANPDGGNVLQTRAFAESKARFDWQPRYFIHQLRNKTLAMMYLTRKVPLTGELWYAPKGPGVIDGRDLKAWLKDFSARAFMIKIDPEIPKAALKSGELKQWGLVPSPRDIQFNTSTVVVDLSRAEDQILASFKPKTRYNIRLAERKGVKVEAVEFNHQNALTMFDLMHSAYKRAGVFVRSLDYFETFWRLHSESGRGQLFLAKHDGDVLAGAYVTYLGKKALYKDGGSNRLKRDVMAAHLLQWEVMRWLKGRGVEQYDLHGVPPADQLNDQGHPLAGLVQFKTGFRAEVVEYIGTWDLPLNTRSYQIWTKFGERLLAGYYHRVKKELFY